jgi:group I intron endonuclease
MSKKFPRFTDPIPNKPFKEMSPQEFNAYKELYNQKWEEHHLARIEFKKKQRQKEIKQMADKRVNKAKERIKKLGATLVSVNIQNHRNPIFRIQCSCGHIEEYIWSDIRQRKTFCKKCKFEAKFTPDDARIKILEKNLHLISEYKNAKEEVEVQCINCGLRFHSLYGKIYNTKHPCPNCNPVKPITQELLNSMFASLGFEFVKEVSKYYYSARCLSCGQECNVSYKDLKRKNLQCFDCKIKTSKEEIVGAIYKLTSPSGKAYIGQTIQSVYDRFREHKAVAFNEHSPAYDTLIGIAIRKYGFDNFKIEILHSNVPWRLLDQYEKDAIKKHKSNDLKFGYNLTEGGKMATSNGRAALRRYEKRIAKDKKLQEKLNKKRAMNFGKNMEIEIKKFLKDHSNDVDEQVKKLSEKLRRSDAAKKASHQPKTSKYIGVCWCKQNKTWKANIKVNGRKIHLGVFQDEESAARAYDEAAVKYRGASAKINGL